MPMLVLLVLAAAPEKDNVATVKADLARLQGNWEMFLKTEDAQVRVEKQIKDQRETVRTFQDGKLVHEHSVDFVLEHTGNVRIFRWKNGQVTAGPRTGQGMVDGAFVYRLQEGEWTGVHGLLEGEARPLIVEIYRRPE